MDRRISPRIEWNGPIKYRTNKGGQYRAGFLADISTTGAMVWLKNELQLGDRLEVVMQSEFDPKPVHMQMQVKRIIEEVREGFHGYGCELERHPPWDKK